MASQPTAAAGVNHADVSDFHGPPEFSPPADAPAGFDTIGKSDE